MYMICPNYIYTSWKIGNSIRNLRCIYNVIIHCLIQLLIVILLLKLSNYIYLSLGRKCLVCNCRSGYKWNQSKFNGIIYGFPTDQSEKELWVRALPNASISNNNITDNMWICEIHWPPRYHPRFLVDIWSIDIYQSTTIML